VSLAQPPGVPRPAAIFLNRAAGSATSSRVRRAVELTRRALDADLHVTATRDAGALRAWMESLAGPYRTVVVAGGDGSLGIAYNLLAGTDVAIGHLPAGFGNATAHLLHLPRRPEALARVLASGDARAVDLVSVDGRLALFAGAGWDALVAGRFAASPAGGVVGWSSSVLRSLPDLWRRTPVHVLADDELVHEGPMELLVVGTTPWFGRGLLVNPGARPDGGRLMARVYTGPAPRFALDAARWLARRRPTAPGVAASVVELRSAGGRPIPLQADGDLLGEQTEWRFEIRPAAARLIGQWSDR
jgi:diacylglycerol kinase family enzyme